MKSRRLWPVFCAKAGFSVVMLVIAIFSINAPALVFAGTEEVRQVGKPISWGSNKIAALFLNYGSDSGIWRHDGSSWRRLTDWTPAMIIAQGSNGLAACFSNYGDGNGLYKYDGSSWIKLTDWQPKDMISYGAGNLAGKFNDYDSGNGIWRHNGESWSKLTDWDPDAMVATGSNEFVGLFSRYDSGNGLWRHDGNNWNRLTEWVPWSISSWGARLTAVFTNYGNGGNGLWVYDNAWKRATDWQPAKVLSWKEDAQLAAVFSDYGASGNGIWNYNGSSWSRLTDWVPTDMVKLGTEDLIAVFKDYGSSGNGVWKYSGTSSSWARITDWVPETVSSSGDYITAIFSNYGSSGNGVWKYQGGNWTRLTDWQPVEATAYIDWMAYSNGQVGRAWQFQTTSSEGTRSLYVKERTTKNKYDVYAMGRSSNWSEKIDYLYGNAYGTYYVGYYDEEKKEDVFCATPVQTPNTIQLGVEYTYSCGDEVKVTYELVNGVTVPYGTFNNVIKETLKGGPDYTRGRWNAKGVGQIKGMEAYGSTTSTDELLNITEGHTTQPPN